MIALCSLMRNSDEYINRYFEQTAALTDVIPDLRVVVGHGDHTDNTPASLNLYEKAGRVELVDCTHGGVEFGSVDNPQRWDLIAGCVRKVIQAVGDDPGTHLIWVESDLIWTTEDMLQLLSDAQVSSACPMVMANFTDRFYDTWGYRVDGAMFLGQPPYWPASAQVEGNMVRVDSCGSCFVTPRSEYPAIQSWSGHWPYRPANLWMDTRVRINHP